MNINFSRRADSDLYTIEAYIAESNPMAAERVINRILQSIRYLSRFPYLGRSLRSAIVRELIIPGLPYRVVYRVETENVRILRILHTSRKRP
ncbi:MAG: type II toxin-antitoxin system mRNA interferase toxin, RelE/StbE family [Alphaproteobacteria bacterium]|nr:type II toxin-antitoxin system mRNA interferase toxin, RelE/StbE family [Alphaproteobacteria bacterium]